jgi:hypothetical protein
MTPSPEFYDTDKFSSISSMDRVDQSDSLSRDGSALLNNFNLIASLLREGESETAYYDM